MSYWKLFGGLCIVIFAIATSWPDLTKWWNGINAGSIVIEYKDFNVKLGMEVTADQVQFPPQVYIVVKEDIPSLYTLLMIDPDSPSRHDPWSADWLHWMVVNMNPTNVSSGEVVMPYSGPSPAPGSDQHNIAFIALRQKGIVSVPTPKTRARFDSKDFLRAHKYSGMVAGTFFNIMGPEIVEVNPSVVQTLNLETSVEQGIEAERELLDGPAQQEIVVETAIQPEVSETHERPDDAKTEL